MRDGVTTDGRDHFHHALAPAEGLDPASTLFSSPPIESLEMLKQLGEIARLSLEPAELAMPAAPTQEALLADASTSTPAAPKTKGSEAIPPKSSDAQLLEALLEYHRLRGPTLGARSAPRGGGTTGENFSRADSSSVPGERFSAIDIPVINDFEPKTSTSPFHAKHPVHSILQPKKRK